MENVKNGYAILEIVRGVYVCQYDTHEVVIQSDYPDDDLHGQILPSLDDARADIERTYYRLHANAIMWEKQKDEEKHKELKEHQFLKDFFEMPENALTRGRLLPMIDRYNLRYHLPQATAKFSETSNAVEWNRRKFNRMDNEQATAFEARCSDTKIEYFVLLSNKNVLKINKTIYNAIKLPTSKGQGIYSA